ncbi:MAG: hypothetical protein JRN03_06120 [Nitrososphaerota archaeon]|nr:hypothetical protein [Nitrososphaerota archaeon]
MAPVVVVDEIVGVDLSGFDLSNFDPKCLFCLEPLSKHKNSAHWLEHATRYATRELTEEEQRKWLAFLSKVGKDRVQEEGR